MERIDLLWDAWEDCLCKEQLRAEFNKLTAENEMLSTKVATLQSQFDKISEPYHYSRDKAEYPWIRHEGKADGCPICNPKCEHKNIGPLALGGTQRCLDCHEWIIAQPLTQCTECGGAMVVEQMAPCPRCKPTHYEYYWGPNISTG